MSNSQTASDLKAVESWSKSFAVVLGVLYLFGFLVVASYHGYRYLVILARNEEPVRQFKLSQKGVHATAAKAGASWSEPPK
jgi:hypothetical protein